MICVIKIRKLLDEEVVLPMMLSKEGIPVDTIKLPVVADILVPTTLDTDCFSRLRKLEIPIDDMMVPVMQTK